MRVLSLGKILLVAVTLFVTATGSSAQDSGSPLRLLDVPFIQQSEALCGGAAAAMVMRYWGATGVHAESFAPLLDEAAHGIHADDLLRDLRTRGWDVRSFRGDRALVAARLREGQPVVALIEDRPGYFHFVVIVAWANGRVIHHDPARAPFRVVDEGRFDVAWEKSDRWTMLLLPGKGGTAAPPSTAEEPAGAAGNSPCDEMVAHGVRTAADGDRKTALGIFGAAAEVCPAASAPLRESAGVHALEGNWAEAERLARAAVERDPGDAHAWRIVATAAYLRADSSAALAAWNAAGEPTIDIVNVLGLDRTRHAVATGLMGLDAGTILTARRLAAATKRLGELPSADVARINYRPLGSGRAAVDAVAVERTMLPSSRASLAVAAARLGVDRELTGDVASPTGGGELISAKWRWWSNRPRIEVSFAAPSRFGVWRALVFGERQSYGTEAPFVERRRGGSLALSNWTSTMTRWEVRAGIDDWNRDRTTASVTASVDQRLGGDRISLRAGASFHAGSFGARTSSVAAEWRSAVRNEGTVVLARAGADEASAEAPHALWPGAGTGQARDVLLRAHPLLDDGRVTGEVFGRRLVHGGFEARRWSRPVLKVMRIAPAAFLDLAAADRRLQPGTAWHADAGAGLRFALPGSGVLRVDLAKGLRDGNTVLSVGWGR